MGIVPVALGIYLVTRPPAIAYIRRECGMTRS